MRLGFLNEYQESFSSIEGAFQFDAALLFMAYNQLIQSQGIRGDTLEIGVRHGLSSIAVAALRGPGRRFFAVDLFDEADSPNALPGGSGSRDVMVSNLKRFYDDIDFIQVLQCDSAELKPADLGSHFSFCHIDGGHSDAETYHDLELCAEILLPGGLLALDDYFNPSFPGVSEGAVRFNLNHAGALQPIAIGFNKVLFQKPTSASSLNAMFARIFSHVPKASATLWGMRVHLFWSRFQHFFDLGQSTAASLISRAPSDLRAVFKPQSAAINANPQESVRLPVKIINTSAIPFHCIDSTFGLSYHLLSDDGVMLTHDNPRNLFNDQLAPGEERLIELSILAPEVKGHYLLEIDIVWEGIAWFKDKGNPTSLVSLTVS